MLNQRMQAIKNNMRLREDFNNLITLELFNKCK